MNSTPLGEVINERQMHRHRTRAGLRIGDARHVDLLRYVAWLMEIRHTPRPEPDGDPYEKVKEKARARNVAMAIAGRDIGELPDVLTPDRKTQAASDFRFFCESYFPLTFHLPWSPDHLKVIAKIEQAVLRGGLFAMAMPRGSGKALALDTPLPTPFGWTTMEKVQVGDFLYDEEGWPCQVRFVTEIMHHRPCYRVTFSDGESIVCDGEHLWSVEDRWSRRNPLTLPTQLMSSRVDLPTNSGRVERRYRVKVAQPLRGIDVELPIHPYVLGYWLGDGSRGGNRVTVHRNDAEETMCRLRDCGENVHVRIVTDNVATLTVGKGHKAPSQKTRRLRHAMAALECGVSTSTAADWSGLTYGTVAGIDSLDRWSSVRRGKISSLRVRLQELGILHEKRIPTDYLRAAQWQRLALLQGLMDTDGSAQPGGRCEITLKDGPLARDLGDLLSGLGLKWTCRTRYMTREGRRFGPFLRYGFSAFKDLPVFRLARKLALLGPRPATRGMTSYRQIVSIDPVPSVPVRCIQVDSPSSLYLCGRKMVPTHNTTICECACIWAVLNGHREFVCLIGSDEGHAMDMLDSIKMELDGNDLLLEDYPEVVFPIQCLDGIANRCNGQLYKGERTHIGWTAREVVLPTMPGSIASGAIIKVAGITGRIRGMKYKRADGHTVRPSLVVIDDPQTDESARSLSQCATRESILAGAILGLSGPGKKISGIMPCTVIRPSDMADNILSRDKHPEWNGERTKMVYSFPTDEKLWQRYGEVRAESLRQHGDIRLATEFYAANQKAMDVGAIIAWPERRNHDEVSAIQHAVNLKLQDEAAFFAEYQNEPLPVAAGTDDELTADAIANKTNRMPRHAVPIACNHLTMFIDVQANLLFFVVTAWEDNFTGYVVDYGSFPDQKRPYFTLRDARNTLSLATKASGLEGAIYAGLERLTADYLSREWKRDDGAMLRIERCLIDANWGSSTDVVSQFCRQSAHASVIMPSHGRFVGASSQPFSEYQRRPGDRVGLNWRVPNVRGKRAVRHVVYDTNFWKSFVHSRLAVTMGDRGCLSLFGDSPDQHRLLAEHLSAEYRVKTEGRGRTVDEWKMRPERGDNHWFDGLVGCAVAASMQGVSLQGTEAVPAPSRQRVSFAELQRSRRK
ncbi:MAG: hypothetical protein CMJ50_09130 [Planctomycetaceae bacterium]|nr:hypothetical protein [Planctomycetaceae bacterium]